MVKLKLYFSYDGTHYHGWQRQANTPSTIQEIFENKLSMVFNKRLSVHASGRTDAGAHARIQVAHVEVDLKQSLEQLTSSLNKLLPPDIRVLKIEEVSSEFHAQLGVLKKTYLYCIDPSPIQWPVLRDYAWNLKFPLDWDAITVATHYLCGEHDFRAFCSVDHSAKTTIRTLFEAYWGEMECNGLFEAKLKVFRITGNGFLKQMVRGIVGTLVYIGQGKAQPELLKQLIKTGDRKFCGPTAPARGLWLWDILYA